MWKITKGTEQHFNGAPDWATHVYVANYFNCDIFVDGTIHGDATRYKKNDTVFSIFDLAEHHNYQLGLLAVRELQSELPAIGGEFELSTCCYGQPKGTPVTVIAHLQDEGHANEIVVKTLVDGSRSVWVMNPADVRPIRSHRDKAIEALLKSVTNFNNTSVIHAVGEIYDAIIAGEVDGLGKVDN